MDQPFDVTLGVPDYTALEFPDPPADRPYVVTNMVMSVDGRAVIEGNEHGLGSPVDQQLMRDLRVSADVVVNGAGTLRASGTSSRVGSPEREAIRTARGLTPHPIAAVLSGSGDLPLDRLFFTARDFDAVIYLGDGATRERREALEATGRTVVTAPAGDAIRAMLRHMRQELGASVLLVEGGPTLNEQLFRLGVVDEYITTIGSVIVGGGPTKSPVQGDDAATIAGTSHLELVSAFANPETSELYLRYRVTGRGA